MGAQARADAAKLKWRYAKHFKVPIEELEVEDCRWDIYIYHPARPDLPRWSLGFND